MLNLDFSSEESARRAYVDFMKRLSAMDPVRWEKLRKKLYNPRPLNVDVVIDDSTLREGLQMAGLTSPLPKDACYVACTLRDIGVERLEVLTYTKSDQRAIKMMRDEGLGRLLAAWCRASTADVDLALTLDFNQVGISHPVSYIHFEKWPNRTLDQITERVTTAVEYARDHGLRVFVHGEDSTRADWSFERKLINAVADAGAEVYRICDTIGCGTSDPTAPLPNGIPTKVRCIKKETKIPHVEIHAHDDLGNAVENTMAAIRAASDLYDKIYVSTTFLGIGERAGNAETEKIILNCYIHHNITKWNLRPLRRLATFLASSINYHLPSNKAIVGDNVFAHESGIHVHGVKIFPMMYETIPPDLVGHKREIVVGKRSGKHGIQMKLEEIMGKKIKDDDPRLLKLVEAVKKKYVTGNRRVSLEEDEFKKLARKMGFDVF